MAVEIKNPSSLRIKYDLGLDDITGKTKVKTKTYSNVAHDAVADKVSEVAQAIATLQNHDVLEVSKLDNTTLGN